MSAVRKSLDGFAVSVMLVLCLCWGLQQVAIKVAAPAIAPVMQIAIRSALAALMVAAVMRMRGVPLGGNDRTFVPGVVVGLLFAGEFLCVALGLNYTTASHMSVFLYTAPIFTTLGLHVWVKGEQMTAAQWLGVATAFSGVIVALSGGLLREDTALYPYMWLGDVLGTLAGLLWGLTTVVIRSTSLSEAEPAKTLLYQLAAAGVCLSGYAWLTGNADIGDMTALAWASMIFQTIAVAFASLLVWFWLLRRYLASRLSVFTFLTPVVGIAMGVWLLSEPLTPAFVAGAILILMGIALVNMPRRRV